MKITPKGIRLDRELPEMGREKWVKIYRILVKKGFYCLNAGEEESCGLLKDGLAVRFAPKGVVIPNVEILFASDKAKRLALETMIPVSAGKARIFVSNLELQIAYKERVLKSPKDMMKANQKQRMEFVDYWGEYVRTHNDRDWSSQQNLISRIS